MKKVLLAIAAVAMLFATSCKNNNEPENIVLGENEFLATIDNGANPQNAPIVHEGNSPQTTIDGNRYVIWETDDEIKINGVTYTTSTSGNSVVFSGTGASGSEFHAFYAVENAGSSASASLPATQTYKAGRVSNLPMYANSTSHQLTFNNICAVLKIVIPSYVDGATAIEVSSDQRMNGAFTVDANNTAVMSDAPSTDDDKKVTIQKENSGTFATNETVYIAVPATSYTNLKIKFVGGASAWEKTMASCTLEVNKIYPINITAMPECLCFTALTAGSEVSFSGANMLDYSTNGTSWSAYSTASQPIPLNSVGDKVYFRAHQDQGNLLVGDENPGIFSGNGSLKVSGNIMYLLKADGSLTNLSDASNQYAFAMLFYEMTALQDASELSLPATTLADYCYAYMFSKCSSLTAAPALPATNLASNCYESMFTGCSILTTVPALPATTLAAGCYYFMFQGCSSLTTAPALPATNLAEGCYSYMFDGCTGLTTAPTLSATTMAKSCYSYMFYGCTGLTAAPALSATTLDFYCYEGMFRGCTGLTAAPALSATTLASYCYRDMFSGCTGLKAAPVLSATTLASCCYMNMFRGCTGLTAAPVLPATTLDDHCYASMFKDCTGLTAAPVLPATTFASYCYREMFSGCSNLNSIEVGFTSWGTNQNATQNWVDGVASSGTFKCPSGLSDTRGISNIPTGWTKVDR